MHAIILAGGMGTRLKLVVNDVPKPMAPVGGKPFLEYQVQQLIRWNIRDIILCVGYKGDVIKSHFGDGGRWGVRISYEEEDVPLGTGGAIREAARLVTGESFLVLNGDSYCDLDFDRFREFHAQKGAVLSLALVKLADSGRYGRVDIDGQCRIVCFREKQGNAPGFVNSGIYLLNATALGLLPGSGPASFEQDVLLKCREIVMYGLQQERFFIDIGVPEDYKYLCRNYKKILGNYCA
jgi:D-glycero-alpha-D-manno-heptose 1-phosphate guanylyltransferase